MIERHIFTVLEQALAAITKTPDILDDLFVKNLGYEQAETEAVKKVILGTPPSLKHGYARSDDKFPMLTITLADENASANFLGNEGESENDPEEPDFAEDVSSNVWEHAYQVYCYAQHPDIALYLYEIVKYAITINIPDFFREKGLWDISITGMELAPDQRYAPEILFLRALTFRCKDEFKQVKRGSRVGKAFKVSGIAVDKSGSASDVGGVPTNVKVYTK